MQTWQPQLREPDHLDPHAHRFSTELKRSFSLLGMVGFSFSIVTCWTALGGTLILGIVSGGPPVMVWSWLGICLLSLTVAYSFAEMCSVSCLPAHVDSHFSSLCVLFPYTILGRGIPSLTHSLQAYPTAGGQYSWVAILAPPKYARGAAWVTGWFMCTGIVAMGAVNNFVSQPRSLPLPVHCFYLQSWAFPKSQYRQLLIPPPNRSDPTSSSAWPI